MLFGAMANEASNSRRDYKRTKLQDKADLREVKENRKKGKNSRWPNYKHEKKKKKTGNKLQQEQRNITMYIEVKIYSGKKLQGRRNNITNQ